jgi:hypothetical protein
MDKISVIKSLKEDLLEAIITCCHICSEDDPDGTVRDCWKCPIYALKVKRGMEHPNSRLKRG